VIHSLQFRLLMAFTLVVVITIGTTFFFIYQTTRSEIRQFEERVEDIRVGRIEDELARYYYEQGNWEGIQPFVKQWGNIHGQRIILTDNQGVVIADSQGDLLGETYQADVPGRVISFLWGGEAIATLYTSPELSPQAGFTPPPPSQPVLYLAIGRFFLWGGLVAVAIAVALTFFLSRRTLAPVKALTFASQRLGRGDFSQRVQIKDRGEFGELARTFNSMAGDLERAEKLRQSMVADIAHELRTPLSNIQGYLEALRDGMMKPDKKTIRSLYEEASLLSRLVDDLQELSLAEAGELKLARRAEDIGELIKQAVAAMEAQERTKGLSLAVELPEKLPPVNIDSRRIGEVLRNLLENAVAHTGKGDTITVAARQRDKLVEISVTDTGEGIPAKDLPNIFERFYRVDKSRTRATGGSGLGLTAVRLKSRVSRGRAAALPSLSPFRNSHLGLSSRPDDEEQQGNNQDSANADR